MLALGLHLSSSDDQCSWRAHYLLVPPPGELWVLALSWCLIPTPTVFVLRFPFRGHCSFSSGFLPMDMPKVPIGEKVTYS